MITEEAIAERIAQLKDEREKFIIQANQTITGYNAAIDELGSLLDNSKQTGGDT